MAKTVVFQEFKNRKMEESAVTVKFSDEHSFVIPPPELWSKEVLDAFASEDLHRVVDAFTDNQADLLVELYGCSNVSFIAMFFEALGIDMGKAVTASLDSLKSLSNMDQS